MSTALCNFAIPYLLTTFISTPTLLTAINLPQVRWYNELYHKAKLQSGTFVSNSHCNTRNSVKGRPNIQIQPRR